MWIRLQTVILFVCPCRAAFKFLDGKDDAIELPMGKQKSLLDGLFKRFRKQVQKGSSFPEADARALKKASLFLKKIGILNQGLDQVSTQRPREE